MNVRVKFSKHGAVRYIGHLDVMRYFQKVMRRAEIDIAYTGGYSPHQIMTFASPLGVGIESDGEYMDLKLNRAYSCEELLKLINSNSVPGIQAVSVKILPEDAGNAMASVRAARYFIRIREDNIWDALKNALKASNLDFNSAIDNFLAQDEILQEKQGKAGLRYVDIKAGVFELYYDEKENGFMMLLDASSGNNINPIHVINLLSKYVKGPEIGRGDLFIYRIDMYTETDENTLISMGDIGEDR